MTTPREVLRRFKKDPNAVIDYTIDWSRWLAGDTLSGAVWTSTSSDLTINFSTTDQTRSQVWVSGGIDKARYYLTCHVTTAAGRQDDRSIAIDMVER